MKHVQNPLVDVAGAMILTSLVLGICVYLWLKRKGDMRLNVVALIVATSFMIVSMALYMYRSVYVKATVTVNGPLETSGGVVFGEASYNVYGSNTEANLYMLPILVSVVFVLLFSLDTLAQLVGRYL